MPGRAAYTAIALALPVLLIAAACSAAGGSDRIQDLYVQELELSDLDRSSGRLTWDAKLVVTGAFADTCTEIGEVERSRAGSTIFLELTPSRIDGEECRDERTEFTHKIPMDAEGLDDGIYELDVNGQSAGIEVEEGRVHFRGRPIWENVIVEQAELESVEVSSSGASAAVVAQGLIPGGECAELDRIVHHPDPETYRVEITTIRDIQQRRPENCDREERRFEVEFDLRVGGYEAGEHSVEVNGMARGYTLEEDVPLPDRPAEHVTFNELVKNRSKYYDELVRFDMIALTSGYDWYVIVPYVYRDPDATEGSGIRPPAPRLGMHGNIRKVTSAQDCKDVPDFHRLCEIEIYGVFKPYAREFNTGGPYGDLEIEPLWHGEEPPPGSFAGFKELVSHPRRFHSREVRTAGILKARHDDAIDGVYVGGVLAGGNTGNRTDFEMSPPFIWVPDESVVESREACPRTVLNDEGKTSHCDVVIHGVFELGEGFSGAAEWSGDEFQYRIVPPDEG